MASQSMTYNRTRQVEELLERTKPLPPSFTIHLHPEHWTLNNGSKVLYNNQFASLLDEVRAHRIPVDFLSLFDSVGTPFYDGCMIVELLDYRPTTKKQQKLANVNQNAIASNSSKEPGHPEKTRVVLHPNSETLWSDICSLNQKTGMQWTDEDALEVESKILLATSDPLCLDPNPHLTRLVNHTLRVSTPTTPQSLKRKAIAQEPEEDNAEKAKRAKIMQFMNPRANRTYTPSYRILDLADKAGGKPLDPQPSMEVPAGYSAHPSNQQQQQQQPQQPQSATSASGSEEQGNPTTAKKRINVFEPAHAPPNSQLRPPSSQSTRPSPSRSPMPPQADPSSSRVPTPQQSSQQSVFPIPAPPQPQPHQQHQLQPQPQPHQQHQLQPQPQPQPQQRPASTQPPLAQQQQALHNAQAGNVPQQFQPAVPGAQFLQQPPYPGMRTSQNKNMPNVAQSMTPQQIQQAQKAYYLMFQQQRMNAAAAAAANNNSAAGAAAAGRSTPQLPPTSRSPMNPTASANPAVTAAQAAKSSPLVTNQRLMSRSPMPPNAQVQQMPQMSQHPSGMGYAYPPQYNPAHLRPVVHGNTSIGSPRTHAQLVPGNAAGIATNTAAGSGEQVPGQQQQQPQTGRPQSQPQNLQQQQLQQQTHAGLTAQQQALLLQQQQQMYFAAQAQAAQMAGAQGAGGASNVNHAANVNPNYAAAAAAAAAANRGIPYWPAGIGRGTPAQVAQGNVQLPNGMTIQQMMQLMQQHQQHQQHQAQLLQQQQQQQQQQGR